MSPDLWVIDRLNLCILIISPLCETPNIMWPLNLWLILITIVHSIIFLSVQSEELFWLHELSKGQLKHIHMNGGYSSYSPQAVRFPLRNICEHLRLPQNQTNVNKNNNELHVRFLWQPWVLSTIFTALQQLYQYLIKLLPQYLPNLEQFLNRNKQY